MVDTTIECPLAITDDLITPAIFVIELFLVEGLLREAQVPWSAVTIAEEIPGNTTSESCEHLPVMQELLSVVLLNGSRENLGTTGMLEMTVSDLSTEDICHHLVWNPEGGLRVPVCHRSTIRTNATCHKPGTRDWKGQMLHHPGLCLQFRQHPLMVLPLTPLVQL